MEWRCRGKESAQATSPRPAGDKHAVATVTAREAYERWKAEPAGEYVFDVVDSANNYFYNWAQLGYSPLDWLTVGLASQRTRVYQTGLDVQRGFFVGFAYRSLSLNVYVFNPGWETPTVVSSVAISF
jgi:hypothetical protein